MQIGEKYQCKNDVKILNIYARASHTHMLTHILTHKWLMHYFNFRDRRQLGLKGKCFLEDTSFKTGFEHGQRRSVAEGWGQCIPGSWSLVCRPVASVCYCILVSPAWLRCLVGQLEDNHRHTVHAVAQWFQKYNEWTPCLIISLPENRCCQK